MIFEYIQNMDLEYPSTSPFNPDKKYKEIPYETGIDKNNRVYGAVRSLLYKSGLDKENYNKACWNPLGKYILPGDTVTIKPNLVKDSILKSDSMYSAIVTNASLIRVMVDYALIAAGKKGTVYICDGPIDTTDFCSMLNQTGILEMVRYLKSHRLNIELFDVRADYLKKAMSIKILGYDIGLYYLKSLHGDPNGYFSFDLGKDSLFSEVEERGKHLRSTQLVRNPKFAAKMHTDGKHMYGISGTIIKSDCIINMPKLKTHKKIGMTLCLKNMVGVTEPRYWLPHFTKKNRHHSDEFDYKQPLKNNLFRFLFKIRSLKNIGCLQILKHKRESNRTIMSDVSIKGSNPENDTIWRTCLDINRIVMHSDKSGILRDAPQRKMLNLVDGIIAGEGDGPMSPDPKNVGMLMFSDNQVLCDFYAAEIIGVPQNKMTRKAKNLEKYKLIRDNFPEKENLPILKFRLPPTWIK